jgi:DNA-directed RNA polymerase specialized sigma24 family protein
LAESLAGAMKASKLVFDPKDTTTSGLEDLLHRLHSDRSRALEIYEQIEWKLIKFFECNSCSPAEYFARRTVYRVIQDIERIEVSDADAFTLNTAHQIAQEARNFECLLRHLSPDRDRASELYEKIRQQLIRFFRQHDCLAAEDFVDETFERVARKLDGQRIDNIYGFVMGFAKNIVHESGRIPRTVELNDWGVPGNLDLTGRSRSEQDEKELHLHCLERCIQELDEDQRQLFMEYFIFAENYKGAAQAKHRQELADRLQLTMNALQVKVHRLKAKVERCVRCRVKQTANRAFSQFG